MSDILRVPHCSHWGAYTLLVKNNEIIGVEPIESDPSPSPIIHSVRQWMDPSLRILRPMVRAGWLEKRERSDGRGRGNEKFVPVSWDDAIELVAGEINRVRGNFGNASIYAGSYGWTSAGRFHHAATLLKRMLNLVGGFTGHVDTYSVAAGLVILRHILGSTEATYGGGSSFDTIIEHTQTLLVFGAMSPRTAQNEAGGVARHMTESYLRQIAERGIKVVMASPLRDDMPEWLNAEWWPIRPNTDTALMIGLAGEIVAADRHDHEFLTRCCSGADRFIDYLKGTTDGKPKNAAWASAITGIAPEKIRALAVELTATRSMVTVGLSLQRAQHGEQPFWAGLALACVAGQVGLPGGGVGYGYGSMGGAGGPLAASRSPAMSQGRQAINSFIPVSRITDMLEQPGATYTYEGETRTYPDVRMLYWAGGNPFHHHQDLNRLAKAWARPETIVVQEPMWTATARRADIILPACTSVERNDLAGHKRSNFIVAMRKAVEPLGESRSDFDIFNDIAARLGVADSFNEGLDEMGWVRHLYDLSREDAAARANFPMIDFETFWDVGLADTPAIENVTYLEEYRKDPEAHRLNTESGRIVIGSETLGRLDYDDCLPHPAWIEPSEWLGKATHPDEMHLISNQPAGRLHSQLDSGVASRAHKRNGREQARLNPADGARLGISDGATIRLWNERGACLATATLDDAVMPAIIQLSTGAWLTQTGNSGLDISGNPNVLTLDAPSSQFGQGCTAHSCLVRVQPYDGDAPDALKQYRSEVAKIVSG